MDGRAKQGLLWHPFPGGKALQCSDICRIHPDRQGATAALGGSNEGKAFGFRSRNELVKRVFVFLFLGIEFDADT